MAHCLLLDTSSLAYRAFFALPTSIQAPHGRPVNAVRGYVDMSARLVDDLRPDDIIHVYDDDWRPAPRVAAYPGYKGERAPDPDDLPWQFTLLHEVLDAFGQEQADAPGWEADDAIAALCHRAGAGDAIDVVTGDRDLLQLVRDATPGTAGIRVLFTVKGVSELARFDEAAVEEKYGIHPTRYADFATLRGDPSDGLPGVRGVGEKTARSLVAAYESLDALLADAARQTPRLALSLRDAADYLEAMLEVVPVRRDVEVRTWQPARDDAALERLATEHNLESPIGRLRAALERTTR